MTLTKVLVSPRYWTETLGLPPLFQTLNGKCLISACTSGSSNFRPIRRLASKTLEWTGCEWHQWYPRQGNVRVRGVHCNLIFGGITDQPFGIGEGDVRGSCAITLIVGNDLDTIVLPDTDAAGRYENFGGWSQIGGTHE